MSTKESIARFILAWTILGVVTVPLALAGLVLWVYCQLPDWPTLGNEA